MSEENSERRTQNENQNKQPLDLAAERRVRLKLGRAEAWHIFERIREADWVKFAQQAGGCIVRQGDSYTIEAAGEEATLDFWERKIARVEGYIGDNWKEVMPPSHRLYAVALLQEIYVVGLGSPLDLSGELKTVELEASWNGALHPRLVHRFRPPQKEHLLKFKRTDARYLQVRGARKPTTRVMVPVNIGALAALWDELIAEVEGYAGYARLQEMDTLHKQLAVTALLDPKPFADALAEEAEAA